MDAKVEHGADLTTVRRIGILVSSVLTVALYFTTILVASTVLPQMQGTFAATPDEVSWSVTFNILATAIAMPMTGWLVARYGRWKVMVWSTAIFTASTGLCGISQSLDEMVLWRILQGAAGAPSVPLVQTILLDTFPPRQHRVVLGIYGMGVVLGPICGPALGGMLSEILNWRWAFFILVPVGAAGTIGLSIFLPRDPPKGPVYLSWTGFLLLSVAVGGVQLVFARGQRLDWFESAEIQITLAVAVLAFYLFVVHSLTSARPFLDLKLLLNRNYAIGLGLITLFGMLNFTPMVLLPALMRTHMGYPDMLVGQVVSSRGIGGIMGFFAVMFLGKVDPRVSVGVGFLLQLLSGYWLMHIDLNSSPLEIGINGAIQGLSSGIIVVALTLTTFPGIPRDRMAEAVSVYHLLRNIGASFFISVLVAEVVRSQTANYARLSEGISPYNKVMQMPWSVGLWDFERLSGLEGFSREINRQAALIGYNNAFGVFTAISALAIPLVFMLRRPNSGVGKG